LGIYMVIGSTVFHRGWASFFELGPSFTFFVL
jgi:hypothetical protein